MAEKWDFSGWATKANIRCADGRTILENAFAGNDGMVVPLVWNHQHGDASNVLGHALLENRGDGVYAYGSFNNTEKGQEAKELVRHGDVRALSIYANQLMQTSKTPPCEVIHGNIREVSLVLAGANTGAYIDNVLMHSGERSEDEAEIFHGDEDDEFFVYDDDEFAHADEDEDEEDDETGAGAPEDEEDDEDGEDVQSVLKGLSTKQKAAVGMFIDKLMKSNKAMQHADDDDDDNNESVADVINQLTEPQKQAVAAAIGYVLKGQEPIKEVTDMLGTLDSKQKRAFDQLVDEAVAHSAEFEDEDYIAHSDEYDESDDEYEDYTDYEDAEMKHNVFDNYETYGPSVSYEDQAAIIRHAAETRDTLKNVVYNEMMEGGVLAHAITDHNNNSITYGVANIDYLFPDARAINDTPELIGRSQEWVSKVINGTHHTPFSRVKSLFADIREDDARAKGYIKGNQKLTEVIPALKRETTPQTIYKLQKLDRDDILDITDFDVVAWLKAEMQIMLKEEIARAILIGDGRGANDPSKIKELNVRPIYNDDNLYTVKVPVNVAATADDNDIASAIIKAVIKSRRLYKGSGNPSFFINEEYLANLLLLEDGMGRRIYETEASLAAALRVKELVPVEIMENKTIAIPTGQGTATADKPLIGVIVNLQDYNVGADKGGQTSFFDDFDIDFNRYEYLYETRMSGALIKPFSAMSVYLNQATE